MVYYLENLSQENFTNGTIAVNCGDINSENKFLLILTPSIRFDPKVLEEKELELLSIINKTAKEINSLLSIKIE